MNQKIYMVLSVRELRKILKLATLLGEAGHGIEPTNASTCIVFRGEIGGDHLTSDIDGARQVSLSDMKLAGSTYEISTHASPDMIAHSEG
jgi:hypothetical protein